VRVSVSVFGRLHAFYLANQLEKRDALDRLYTSYPKFGVAKYGIPPAKIDSFPYMEAAFRLWLKLPGSLTWGNWALPYFARWYDAAVASHLTADADIFHGWSTYSLASLQRAQRFGALATLQRGSAHIRFQQRILQEEYARFGVNGVLPDPSVVKRELEEYQMANYIFVPSTFARNTFLAEGLPENKVLVVPLGVSMAQFHASEPRDSMFRVIYVGSMSLRKGVHYLLQAFTELHLPDAELWLVGQMQSEMKGHFRRFAGAFRYFPAVPQSELQTYYSQCSAFALCSLEDGFGQVLTQAMACGLPVICTTNTGGPDVVTEGVDGFITAPRNVEQLKDRISFLYHHRDVARAMGENARVRAASALSWDQYGERIFATFRSVLARGPARSLGAAARPPH
jgi:glycosyltransferase involved in cell wall biosynthesis